MDQAYGDGRRGSYERESDRMGQSRSLLCGDGSKLFPKEEVAAGNWQYITDKCKEALGYIAEARI